MRQKLISEKYIIECKRPDVGGYVGVRPVRELLGVKSIESATKAILVTTAHFSKDAQIIFEEKKWELEGKDFHGLWDWIQQYRLQKKVNVYVNLLQVTDQLNDGTFHSRAVKRE